MSLPKAKDWHGILIKFYQNNQQREALEAANVNTSVLETMNTAAKAIKKAHKGKQLILSFINYEQNLRKF